MGAGTRHSLRLDPRANAVRLLNRRPGQIAVLVLMALLSGWATAAAADTINAYSIWPENWARPMLQEFEAATGIKVNFLPSPPAKP